MSDFLMKDLYALTDLERPRCARMSGWCDGLTCWTYPGGVHQVDRWCPFSDLDPESDEIMRAHHRAMHEGTMAKDILELGIIQEGRGDFQSWLTGGDGYDNDERYDVIEVDPDVVEAFIMDHASWLPMEAGW